MPTNLFKKAAVFTDIHFGLKSNSISHNTDCNNFVDWFIEKAQAEGCETCLFLGDFHHNRANINVLTLNYIMVALEKLGAAFETVYFLPGNHDLYYKDRRDIQSSVWAKHIPNVQVKIEVEGLFYKVKNASIDLKSQKNFLKCEVFLIFEYQMVVFQ